MIIANARALCRYVFRWNMRPPHPYLILLRPHRSVCGGRTPVYASTDRRELFRNSDATRRHFRAWGIGNRVPNLVRQMW